MMQHYLQIKEQNKDAVVFYRLGDFYEMFFDDAKTVSKELDLTLTGRDCGLSERAPMCGVPFHSCDTYIAKLVENGHKVAICEQMEDPATAKGLVDRQVIRIITPGTVIEKDMLDEGRNNYILSLLTHGNTVGIAFADCSTGEIRAGESTSDNSVDFIINELCKLSPAEVLLSDEFKAIPEVISTVSDKLHASCEFISGKPDRKLVLRHFNAESFASLDIGENEAAQDALSNLLSYLYATQMSGLENLHTLKIYNNALFMKLDASTRRNLEITETLRTRERRGSLLGVVDKTKTAMGKRMLRSWLEQPLLDTVRIDKRLNAVRELIERPSDRAAVRALLDGMLDVERLMSRIVYGSANAQDLLGLKNIIERLPKIKKQLEPFLSNLINSLNDEISPLTELCALIDSSIDEKAPVTVREGKMIKAGYNAELDELRSILSNGKDVIRQMEAREKEATGIKTLKVGYNKVFGYYIEVSNMYKDQVPDTYIRKQTLTNGERYITESLKEWESKVLGAQERVSAIEFELFSQVRKAAADRLAPIQTTAGAVAALDALCSMAEVSAKNRYCMPDVLPDSGVIEIKGGRHPVVEDMRRDEPFVPNDTLLDLSDNRTMIITGPNMAGKSTYMRQVALIVLMAQVGMFVPAASAKIGVVDSIYTRVGASDDLSSGDSTFMVEMKEVAYILNNATQRSLVIFDEIGRGTSTFDGMSIARAAIEYTSDKIKAKALFATHYHELTELESQLNGIKNYNITVKKRGEDVIFLRKLARGGADQSLGIEIAKLAGAPKSMVNRAKEILRQLQESEIASVSVSKRQQKKEVEEIEDDVPMLAFGESKNEKAEDILLQLKAINVDTLSPIEAMNVLYKLCKNAQDE